MLCKLCICPLLRCWFQQVCISYLLCAEDHKQRKSSMLQWKIRGVGNNTNWNKCNTKQTVDKCGKESTKCFIISRDVSSWKQGCLERPDDLRVGTAGVSHSEKQRAASQLKDGRDGNRIGLCLRVSDLRPSKVSLLPSSRRKTGSALDSWKISCSE